MGTGYHGGFGNGTKGAQATHGNLVSLPQNDAQIKHIFSGQEGHFTDTPSNRETLLNLANDQSKYVGTDKYGNAWNVEINRDGSQNWIRYQNGTVNEGGQNKTPRPWNDETGLNNNPVKRRRRKK